MQCDTSVGNPSAFQETMRPGPIVMSSRMKKGLFSDLLTGRKRAKRITKLPCGSSRLYGVL